MVGSARSERKAPVAPTTGVLWGLALAIVLAAGTSVWLGFNSDHVDEPEVQGALMAWMVLGYGLAGLVAWSRRPGPFGPLMVLAGFAIFLSSLSWANGPVLFTIGIAFDLVPVVVFLHVVLAFPTGRLETRVERLLVSLGYVTALGVQVIAMALDGFGADNLLTVDSQSDAALWVSRVQLCVLAAVSLGGIGVLVDRRRVSGRPLRRTFALLVDSFALGLAMIAFLFLSAALGLVEGDPAFETIRRATFFVIGLAPIVLLVGLLHAHLRRSGVGNLVVELQANPAPQALERALARAVGDPALTLAYWLPEFGSYADLDGRPVTLPTPDERVGVMLIEKDGAPVAALLHDASLLDEPELLDSVTAVAAISIENARLQSELRARVDELAASRARVIAVGQDERQRLERNLHDGAQQRLVALSLDLGRLEQQVEGDEATRARLEQARQQIAVSLGELRDVARGIHPAVVSAHGLAVALEELAARAPVPVDLTVELDGRLPEPVEVAAYYVITESIANIGKHAHATRATVRVARAARHDDGTVIVEVVDDGIGGADTERGSGLRGLADRVEALGGRLRIWTPVGEGTRVRAEIPCEL